MYQSKIVWICLAQSVHRQFQSLSELHGVLSPEREGEGLLSVSAAMEELFEDEPRFEVHVECVLACGYGCILFVHFDEFSVVIFEEFAAIARRHHDLFFSDGLLVT